MATIGTIALPGFGTLIVAGPLVAAWGLTGAGAGALTGGIVGALVDAGIPEERAKMYEDAIKEGEVLVTVTTSHGNESKIRSTLEKYGAYDRQTVHASYA